MKQLKCIKTLVEGTTLIATLSRPEAMNALNAELIADLEALVQDLMGDSSVRAVVLTGQGEKAFVAGADIKQFELMTPVEAEAFAERGQSLFAKFAQLPQPVVAAMNGFALKLSDEGIALIGATALFLYPLDFGKGKFILDWRDTQHLPWGILLLFGGGLSLADALANTGIIDLIGNQFAGLESAGFLLIIGLTAVSLYLTELMSNVALVTIFLPVVGGVAVGAGIDPILVLMPVTLAASCAFMLPMSTPPNAIVFASGHIKIAQMVRAGFWLNIIAILLIAALVEPMVQLIFSDWPSTQ